METRAYPEYYVQNAMSTMATMLDYAVNCQRENIDYFFSYFINMGFARQFEIGNPDIIVGRSGAELYHMIKCDYYSVVQPNPCFDRSEAFWLGWSLAYYQWYKNITFWEIGNAILPSEMLLWYPTLHEADLMRFVESVDMRIIQWRQNQSYQSVPAYYIDFSYVPFQNQLMQGIIEENRRIAYLSAGQQPYQTRLNHYRYEYINQFPYQNMRIQRGWYYIEQPPFLSNWNIYWQRTVAREQNHVTTAQAPQRIDEIAREVLGESLRRTGNAPLAFANDLYSILTADSLLDAIVKILDFMGSY